jgi:hypothetical protein
MNSSATSFRFGWFLILEEGPLAAVRRALILGGCVSVSNA